MARPADEHLATAEDAGGVRRRRSRRPGPGGLLGEQFRQRIGHLDHRARSARCPRPAAPRTAGTITWAEPPGSAPTWILPVVPAADFTVYSTNSFSYELWRPLYWTQNGVSPTIDQALSLADPPTYSNGDKTVTVRLKTNYKWSDGQPVTSKDALFYVDEVRAAVKESGANWGSYSPGSGYRTR